MPQTDFEELAKIPDLVAHFQEHKDKDNNLSFLTFIQKHYSSNHKNEEDHSKLPLLKHCSCLFYAVLQAEYPKIELPSPVIVCFSEAVLNSKIPSWNGSDYRLNLLKPPRI